MPLHGLFPEWNRIFDVRLAAVIAEQHGSCISFYLRYIDARQYLRVGADRR